jgi:hypothetical protein
MYKLTFISAAMPDNTGTYGLEQVTPQRVKFLLDCRLHLRHAHVKLGTTHGRHAPGFDPHWKGL